MPTRVLSPEEFSQGLVRAPHRRRAPRLGEAGRRLFRCGLGEAGSEECGCGGSSEGAERLGVETGFHLQRKEPPVGGSFVDAVTCENERYILMVTGSVSLKLRADSAGRTISFAPV